MFAHRKNYWRVIMMNDPIVNEVRKNREQLAKKFNYDIHAIFTDVRKRQFLLGNRLNFLYVIR